MKMENDERKTVKLDAATARNTEGLGTLLDRFRGLRSGTQAKFIDYLKGKPVEFTSDRADLLQELLSELDDFVERDPLDSLTTAQFAAIDAFEGDD